MNYRTLGILLGIIFSVSLVFQIWQLYRFVSAGPRFTTNDGQELCERIQKLESQPQPCRYMPP